MMPSSPSLPLRFRALAPRLSGFRLFPVLTALCLLLWAPPLVRADNAGKVRWVLQDLGRFPDPEVVAMAMDDQGTKWFGTKKGLVRLSILEDWQTFTLENTSRGLPGNVITALAIGENRELWVATDGGVGWYANGSWKTFTRENTSGGLPDNAVTSLAIGKDEKWFGTKSGFAMLRGSQWTSYNAEKVSGRLPNKLVTAIALDSSGDKWIGTIGGLVRFSGSTWTLMTRDNTNGGLPHSSITALTIAPNGLKWVGTQMGLAKSAAGVWTSYKGSLDLGELASEQVYGLYVGKSGVFWASGKGGAAVLDGTSWRLYNKNNTTSIQTRIVYAAMVGLDGETWFGTQRGVVVMVPVKDE